MIVLLIAAVCSCGNGDSDVILFSGGSCRLDTVDLKPMFAPAGMAKGNKAFCVKLKYTLESGKDNNVLSVLYKDGQFVAPDGKSYKAGAAAVLDTAVDAGIYTLIVAVPENVEVKTLKFKFKEQTLSLK
ncbi:MAG: hypothetical protein LBS69_02460 [Prevotellaceae bacterium]|nr:hypothetical protein [Prevotellaceae bacterium]